MNNKEAVEHLARLFDNGLAATATNNIGGRAISDAYTCSLYEAKAQVGITIVCFGSGRFEARMTYGDHRIVLLSDPTRVGFEKMCKALKHAYDTMRDL